MISRDRWIVPNWLAQFDAYIAGHPPVGRRQNPVDGPGAVDQ